MSYDKSEVMNEFFKIAQAGGLDKVALPSKNPHQEDKKTIEEKRIKKEKDIIEVAHPSPVYIAEAKGDGGLVENQNELHNKIMLIINKMPTGTLVHRYASSVIGLLKMAEQLDAVEESDAADLLTNLSSELVKEMGALTESTNDLDKAVDTALNSFLTPAPQQG